MDATQFINHTEAKQYIPGVEQRDKDVHGGQISDNLWPAPASGASHSVHKEHPRCQLPAFSVIEIFVFLFVQYDGRHGVQLGGGFRVDVLEEGNVEI